MSRSEELFVIPGLVGSRKLLFVHLLAGPTWVWIDTGIATTPDDHLFPWLEQKGIPVPDRQIALVTHADVDHFGGLSRLRDRFPSLLAAAGVADMRWIEDRRALMDERYARHQAEGIVLDLARVTELETRGGPTSRLDIGLTGGERLGSDGRWEVLDLPGHSMGHVGVWQPSVRRAVIGDALLGWGLRDVDGALMSSPPYFDVPAYMGTIDRVEAMGLDELHTSHFPVMRGSEIADFVEECRQAVETIGAAVWQVLTEAGASTLLELCVAVAKMVGRWPPEATSGLADPISAHLAHWAASGRVMIERTPETLMYVPGEVHV